MGFGGLVQFARRVSRPSSAFQQANIDLPVDVFPLLAGAEGLYEFVEQCDVLLGELEPRQKIEWLAELSTLVQPSGNRG